MSVKEFFAEQKLILARAARRSSFAKERASIKLLQEMEIFREAVRSEAEEDRSLAYRAQQAVALATAVRETLVAKKAQLEREIEEAALRLRARRDKSEDVTAKLAIADVQLNNLTFAVRNQNLGRDWTQGRDVYVFRPKQRHQEQLHFAGAMDNESGPGSDESGLESFYEAPDSPAGPDDDDD